MASKFFRKARVLKKAIVGKRKKICHNRRCKTKTTSKADKLKDLIENQDKT